LKWTPSAHRTTCDQDTYSLYAIFQLWTCQLPRGYPAAVSDNRQTLFVGTDLTREACFRHSCSNTEYKICNASVQSGDLPETQKSALVVPQPDRSRSWMLKMPINLRRPIHRFQVVPPTSLNGFTTRFTAHAERHNLFPSNQSAYRRHHNTATAVASVTNDMIRAIDGGEVTESSYFIWVQHLTLLDHCTLLDIHIVVLRWKVYIQLLWFNSYLISLLRPRTTKIHRS